MNSYKITDIDLVKRLAYATFTSDIIKDDEGKPHVLNHTIDLDLLPNLKFNPDEEAFIENPKYQPGNDEIAQLILNPKYQPEKIELDITDPKQIKAKIEIDFDLYLADLNRLPKNQTLPKNIQSLIDN